MSKLMEKIEQIENSDLLKEFIQGSLISEPARRIKALELVEMDFVKFHIPVDFIVISDFVQSFDIWKS
uniref:Uncharacterized protein n=1 Tax=Panagrolaimus sp. JU765 TaxID=591449 RepID=A0AC34PVH5_9BILA